LQQLGIKKLRKAVVAQAMLAVGASQSKAQLREAFEAKIAKMAAVDVSDNVARLKDEGKGT